MKPATSPVPTVSAERAEKIWDDAWRFELDHHHPQQQPHGPAPAPRLAKPQPQTGKPQATKPKSPPARASLRASGDISQGAFRPQNAKKEPGRNIIPFEPPELPEQAEAAPRSLSESPLKRILADIDARAITPRQMQELSLDLYVGGILTWDEYVELAFQPDLHPDFGRTIGALTGEKPLPDQPRDYVREWERRLDYERRFAPTQSRAKERALHILSVLRRIEQPASLLA